MPFKSRQSAGQKLAQEVAREGGARPVVLAIPRGGISVAAPVARQLSCPLSVIVVKKLAAPGRGELAIGAMGEDEQSLFLNQALITQLDIEENYLAREKERVRAEVVRRQRMFLGDKRADLQNKKVIIVDDGVATGATAIAAARQARLSQPDEVILATPVIGSLDLVKKEFDRVIFLEKPKLFFALSQFYEEFPQVSDERAKSLLEQVG